MPYRSKQAVTYLRNVLELSRDPSIYHGPPLQKLEMFLGNAHMDVRAMRVTLDIVDREGLQELHAFGGAIEATRVYEIDGVLNCGTPADIFTISPEGPLAVPDPLHPTFHYAPELLRTLGDTARLEAFLRYVRDTILSHRYRAFLDLPMFL